MKIIFVKYNMLVFSKFEETKDNTRVQINMKHSPINSVVQEKMNMCEARDILLASDRNEIIVMNDGKNMMTISKYYV